jgi:hypothetical protein
MRSVSNLDTRPVAIILAVIEAIMNEISRYVPITKAKNDLLGLSATKHMSLFQPPANGLFNCARPGR